MYYKIITDGCIVAAGTPFVPSNGIVIKKKEYDSLLAAFQDRPADTWETVYYLSESGAYETRSRTEAEKVGWFVMLVENGTITIDEVPTDYKSEVEQLVTPSEEPDLYQQGYEQALIDLAETTGGMK